MNSKQCTYSHSLSISIIMYQIRNKIHTFITYIKKAKDTSITYTIRTFIYILILILINRLLYKIAAHLIYHIPSEMISPLK